MPLHSFYNTQQEGILFKMRFRIILILTCTENNKLPHTSIEPFDNSKAIGCIRKSTAKKKS